MNRRPIEDVLVLGAGYAGSAVAAQARASGLGVRVVVRRDDAEAAWRARGVDVVRAPVLGLEIAALAGPGTHVVVAFPPDGETDARIAGGFCVGGATGVARARGCAAITYVSSTVVYDQHGILDDGTPVGANLSAAGSRRLVAEGIWRELGATVLRAPAIYGPDRGLHRRVIAGAHRVPGDGRGFVSRIHVEDLAALVLAAPRAPGETFVVGDAEPAAHGEVVAWIAAAFGVPIPPSVPLTDVHETLRGDRRIDGSRALRALGVALRYPSYREGMR